MIQAMKTQFTVLTNAEAQRTQSHAEKGIHNLLRVSPRSRRLCVKLPLASLLLCVLALMPLGLRAATNDLTAALQKGLFEEEANRNLDAAVSNYQSLAAQFDQDRQVAATAIFRLGECYRKLGQTNEAVVQYQRIVRDFSDQATLATLSRQNLAGLGTTPQASSPSAITAESMAKMAQATELEAEAASLKTQIVQLSGLKREDRRITVQQNFSNPVLTSLVQQLNEAEQKLASLTNDFAPQSTQVVNATVVVNAINGQIDTQVEGAIKGLQTKMEADLNTAKTLRAQSSSMPSVRATVVTDDEEQEIRRIQAMIQNSPDLINAPSGEAKLTPLCTAAIKDQLRVAAFLLDNGANINQTANWKTPLHFAANAGHKRMVDLLISRGADVNAKDGSDKTALHLAMERNFPAVAETLLAARADVNAGDGSATTPLMLAAKNGNRKLAAAMLALGANLNLQNKKPQGWAEGSDEQYGTALHLAVARKDAAMVALLLTNHADVKQRSITGDTPLDIAALMDATEIAVQLIAAGAEVNAAGPVNSTSGATPLLRATGNGHSDAVKLLLEQRANPNTAYNPSGITPLMLAAADGNTNIAGMLLAHGARMDLEDNSRETALFKAVNRDKTDAVQLLLARGANPNERQDGYPLLFRVITKTSNPDILAAFLKAKADVNAANSGDYTALHLAAIYGRKDLVEMLLAAGADPNLRTKEGKTPLDYAKDLGAKGTEIVTLLRSQGALDNLPNWDRITASRPSANYSTMVFQKGTNDWNRFTLLELIARQYGFITSQRSWPSSVSRPMPFQNWTSASLQFPDFKHVVIHRPTPDGRKWMSIPVDASAILESGDGSRDVALQWGDAVEISETDHPISDVWQGFTSNAGTNLIRCISRSVKIVVQGTSTEFKPALEYVTITPSGFNFSRIHSSFMVRAVLDQSKLIRFSSDLSRVKVTRRDPKTGKKIEWVLDCSGDNAPDLWLREGDVIEVPEK